MIPTREVRGVASPFAKLLLTDVWDGPKSGLAIESSGTMYAFHLLDWDDRHSRRVFSMAVVPGADWREERSAFQEPEEWTEWVLPVSLSPRAEELLRRAEAEARLVAVVASSDLLRSIDVWRPCTGALATPERGGWLEALGISRAG
jgi:hypothetical protein